MTIDDNNEAMIKDAKIVRFTLNLNSDTKWYGTKDQQCNPELIQSQLAPRLNS